MIPSRVIEAKRNGERLSRDTLEGFFRGYLEGTVAEYQMSAFLMAVLFRGLDAGELDVLTGVMVDSGATLDLGALGPARVDKHSTGGVGDKVSLVLAPLVAALGVPVPMMSGRGLGHTGGTLDKLESIPGFRTGLELDAFRKVLADVGCAMIGQTEDIAPLDRRLYDLRSVTGTVPSIPLISASIMSKKLAEDLTGLVLDVKVGEGAFVQDPERALDLARTMVRLGQDRGVPTVALLTAMDRPLGRAVGNALEVEEAVDALRGGGPDDLRAVVLALAAEMALLGGVTDDREAAVGAAAAALDDGSALDRFRRLVEAQGGDPAAVDDPVRLPRAPVRRTVAAERAGPVRAVRPTALGWGVVELGGGRRDLGETIDPSVGFALAVEPGSRVEAGDPLGVVHAASEEDADRGEGVLREAVRIGGDGSDGGGPLPLLLRRVTRDGVEELG